MSAGEVRGLDAIEAHLDDTWRSDEPDLAMRPAGDDVFLARSVSQGFDGTIGAAGAQVRLHDGSPTIRLRARAVVRGGARHVLAEGHARADGARVHIARPGVDELFAHGPAGLEHALAITEVPAGEGPLEIVLAIEGASALRVADDVITMLDAAGAAYLEYASLRVWDGTGRALPAHFAHATGGARIVIDDRGATSPIVIDPLIAAPRGVIVASDAAEDGGFGTRLAVDGDWAVVGAPDHAMTGVAYVLERTGTTWTERARLVPPDARDGDDVGYSVAISGDTLAIGSPYDDHPTSTGAGSVHVYRRGAGGWTFEQRIENHDPEIANERFGSSVALAGDLLVVGTPGDRAYFSNGGGAYVYARTGVTWALEHALVPSTISNNDAFGTEVATDGTHIAVSSIRDNGLVRVDGFLPEHVGAVFVFARGTSEPWEQEARLSSSAPERSYELCGESLAIRNGRVIAGATRGDDDEEFVVDRGVAYIWARTAGVWTLEARLRPEPITDWTTFARFGWSVAIDGDVAVVGATGVYRAALGRSPGFAYVYQRDAAGTWNGELDLTGRVLTSDYGQAVALDGTTLLVGASDEQVSADDQGAVYAYELVEPRTDGETCAASTECLSGFCTDGVCCESACGGGASDCLACSVAAGAASDGVCGTAAAATVCRAAVTPCDAEETCDGSATTCPADLRAAAGTECRPAISTCDVAESCDGLAATCPTDARAADGSACDDGMRCDGAADVCSAGSCVGGDAPLECDDGDRCTADVCAEPGGCAHMPIDGCCVVDEDCDDADPCTVDRCDGTACAHEPTGACEDASVSGPDGGMASDGGATDHPGDGGCGCMAPGRATRGAGGAWLAISLAALVLARRRRTCRS